MSGYPDQRQPQGHEQRPREASTSPRGAIPPQSKGGVPPPEGYYDDPEGEYDLSSMMDDEMLSYGPRSFGELVMTLAMSLAERSFNIAIRAPMDRIECLLQLRSEMRRQGKLKDADDYGRNPIKCAKTCFKKQGLTGFWRGYFVRCGSLFPLMMINNLSGMLSPTFFNVLLVTGLPELQCYFASSCMSYIFVAVFSHPIEVIQLRLSCELSADPTEEERIDGACSFVKRVVKREGILAMWRGLSTSLLVSGLANISFLACAEVAGLVYPRAFDSPIKEACSTFLIMCVASTFVHPINTIRRRLIMTIGSEKKYRYSGILDVVRTISKEPGGLWGGLFQGLPFFLGRSVSNFTYSLVWHIVSTSRK